MTLKRGSATGGNKWGRPFLSVKSIPDGLTATIDRDDAYQEVKDFGDGEKQVLNVPVRTEQMIDGETDFCWTPGQLAEGFLIDQLGEDETKWKGRHGRFDRKWEWETKTRSGISTALVMDGTTTPKAEVETRKVMSHPIQEKASTGGTKNKLQCPLCDFTCETNEEMKKHLKAKHS